MATVIGLAAARQVHAGGDVRRDGLQGRAGRLVGYASREAHGCVAKAFELLGLGRDSLRLMAVDRDHRIKLAALERAIAVDRAAGLQPFCVVGAAGTVNTGAIDDLLVLAELCRAQGLWFHVDAAFGGLALLVPALAPRLAGIERADSLAFDFHKWLHVPYEAGCVLVRDAAAHRAAFALRPDYLAPAERGLAGGNPWFCEYGVDLSRGLRALKIWFTLQTFGLDRLGAAIRHNCEKACYLGRRVEETPELELLAPVSLNIACFRYHAPGLDPAHSTGSMPRSWSSCTSAASPRVDHPGRRPARHSRLPLQPPHRQTDLDALIDGVIELGQAQRRASKWRAMPAATETLRLSMRASISSLARKSQWSATSRRRPRPHCRARGRCAAAGRSRSGSWRPPRRGRRSSSRAAAARPATGRG